MDYYHHVRTLKEAHAHAVATQPIDAQPKRIGLSLDAIPPPPPSLSVRRGVAAAIPVIPVPAPAPIAMAPTPPPAPSVTSNETTVETYLFSLDNATLDAMGVQVRDVSDRQTLIALLKHHRLPIPKAATESALVDLAARFLRAQASARPP
jgi:hypothetical protein